MDEFDFEYDEWNYYQVSEEQNRGIDVLEVCQRLKLAEINLEQLEWRLKREFERKNLILSYPGWGRFSVDSARP